MQSLSSMCCHYSEQMFLRSNFDNKRSHKLNNTPGSKSNIVVHPISDEITAASGNFRI